MASALEQMHQRPPEEPTALEPNLTTAYAAGEQLSDRIKAAISVYNYVSQHVELDERGRGHCPFHPDNHKSFNVNAEKTTGTASQAVVEAR